MPRMGRVMLPSYPHHVVQRGRNRQVIFAEARDYWRYLDALAEFKVEFGIKVYAYWIGYAPLIASGARQFAMISMPALLRRPA